MACASLIAPAGLNCPWVPNREVGARSDRLANARAELNRGFDVEARRMVAAPHGVRAGRVELDRRVALVREVEG